MDLLFDALVSLLELYVCVLIQVDILSRTFFFHLAVGTGLSFMEVQVFKLK